MTTCGSCGSNVAENSRFCPACGAALHADPLATVETSSPDRLSPGSRIPVQKTPSSKTRTSSDFAAEARFPPGALLAERYRIVAPLGRGGMGEVYRAEDLVLGQPVALKFLPETAAENEAIVSRFRNEVRIARQVSHPNVCRVYDVGQTDGSMFLSMEYVDGEDPWPSSPTCGDTGRKP